MRARVFWAIGLSVGVLATTEACGSDSGSGANNDHDGGGGANAGAGGKIGTGGYSAAGGNDQSGAGGMGGRTTLPCDTSSCDSPAMSLEGMLGGLVSVPSCCIDEKTCGVDLSGLATFGLTGAGCVDPSTLGGNPIPVTDGGVIYVEGGLPIQLDKQCPDVAGASASTPGASYFTLPGCCRPAGKCGGSTHTLTGAGASVPLVCDSYDQIAAAAATAAFSGDVVVADDPNIPCEYTAASVARPDGGVTHPDGGITMGIRDSGPADVSRPEPEPDAAPRAHDAAAPAHEDATPG